MDSPGRGTRSLLLSGRRCLLKRQRHGGQVAAGFHQHQRAFIQHHHGGVRVARARAWVLPQSRLARQRSSRCRNSPTAGQRLRPLPAGASTGSVKGCTGACLRVQLQGCRDRLCHRSRHRGGLRHRLCRHGRLNPGAATSAGACSQPPRQQRPVLGLLLRALQSSCGVVVASSRITSAAGAAGVVLRCVSVGVGALARSTFATLASVAAVTVA